MRMSDWSSYVCSSDLFAQLAGSSPMGEGHSGNVLLDGLNAAPGEAQHALRQELQTTFRHLMLISAAVSLLGLAVAVAIDRKRVVEGTSVSVRVDLGGSRIITKKKKQQTQHYTN